jgi:Putative esterase
MLRRTFAVAAVFFASVLAVAQPPAKPAGLKFRVKIAVDQVGKDPESGRVLVAVGRAKGEPDFLNYRPPVLPVLGTDADAFTADKVITLDANSDVFPLKPLDELPAGEYTVQAVFATNRDINLPFAPGNRYCQPVKVKLDPVAGTTVTLTLDRGLGQGMAEPKATATHKFLSIPSKLLSDFHGRPMVYRVGVVLPPDFEKEPDKKYGLVVDIGGFGSRYTQAIGLKPDPRFVQILPDGAGPFGDPYHVNSANNGPYGDALTTEVIPYVEKTYRCLGTPKSRFTTGGSTGGWVSLALQVFYPDFFNGCWSECPDSVTFERFELIDIYRERNAYVNRFGFDRPGTRTIDGDTVATVRHECQLERVLGRGGKWELGGRDWASWNAVYGPKGKDGLPVPLWDGKTGAIDKSVLDHWRKYDLKLVLEKNWKELGPKLAGGKVNIWVGDADDYFLNVAVGRLKDSTEKLKEPKFDGTILIEARKGHGFGGWTRKEIFDAMAERMK